MPASNLVQSRLRRRNRGWLQLFRGQKQEQESVGRGKLMDWTITTN